jgi:alpha-methylacyl-CoA racemase
MGLLAAHIHARQSGRGQVVDASIVDGTLSLTMAYAMRRGPVVGRARARTPLDGSCPFGTCYETADGQYMVRCALSPRSTPSSAAAGPAAKDCRGNERARWPALRESASPDLLHTQPRGGLPCSRA